jgi:hypothetical protein
LPTLNITSILRDSYNTSDSATMTNGTSLLVSRNSSSVYKYPYLQFDLRGIPVGAVITSAILHCYVYAITTTGATMAIRARPIISNWEETGSYTVTVDTTATYLGTATWSAIGDNTVNITNMFTDWVNGVLTNYGVRLETTGATTPNTYTLASSENTTYAKPYIEVTYELPEVNITAPLVGATGAALVPTLNIGQGTEVIVPLSIITATALGPVGSTEISISAVTAICNAGMGSNTTANTGTFVYNQSPAMLINGALLTPGISTVQNTDIIALPILANALISTPQIIITLYTSPYWKQEYYTLEFVEEVDFDTLFNYEVDMEVEFIQETDCEVLFVRE